jgi:hypothetical protein
VLQLFTESSGNPNLGCGAYFAGYWVQFQWPNHWSALPMIKKMALYNTNQIKFVYSVATVVTQTRPTQQEPIQEEPSFLSLVMHSNDLAIEIAPNTRQNMHHTYAMN